MGFGKEFINNILEEMPTGPRGVTYGFSEPMGGVLLGKLKHNEVALH